jgi:hypothetical protein
VWRWEHIITARLQMVFVLQYARLIKSRNGDKLLNLNTPCTGFAFISSMGNERAVLWLFVYFKSKQQNQLCNINLAVVIPHLVWLECAMVVWWAN